MKKGDIIILERDKEGKGEKIEFSREKLNLLWVKIIEEI